MADFSVDFSPIATLPTIYRRAQMEDNRQRTLADLGRGASVADVSRALFQAGDIQGGLSLANLANAQAQQDWTRTYQGGMLDLARQNAQRREEPDDIRKLRAAGISPNSPEGRKALFPRTDTPISATDKKAIFEAENDVPRLEATIANIQRAKELNPTVYSGVGASYRGALGAKFPDWMVPDAVASPKRGEATAEWDQLMGSEAIKMMSETLKGASTDFEMRKFIGIAADTSQSPQVRQNAMDRFLALANKELDLRRRRAGELRSGTYFKPGGGEQGGPRRVTQEEYNALPSGATYTAPDGSTRTKR